MARPRDKMTRSQKQWDTINNINEHYVDAGLLTDRERKQRVAIALLSNATRSLDGDMPSLFADLGLAGLHQDVSQRLATLLAAVKAAGGEG